MCNIQPHSRKRLSKQQQNVFGGLLLLIIGGILLARQAGADLPPWLFTWPMLLIIVGLFVGTKTHFKDFGWLVLVGVGAFFLIDKIQDMTLRDFIFPIAIMAVGVLILLVGLFEKRKNIREENSIPEPVADDKVLKEGSHAVAEDIMEVVSVFGSTKRVVLSKNFKGGEIVSVFGSAEINLTNADFNGRLILEVVQIFGGTKLIIPPHWEVQSNTAAVFGGIEDKRSMQKMGNPEKVLVLDGVTIFGGVTIASY